MQISNGQFVHCDCQVVGCQCGEQFFINDGKVIPDHPKCTRCIGGRHVGLED